MHFAQPWFLLGLITLAVPIVVHLFNFRKPKILVFSNLKFIKESVIEVNKTQKIKHFLVLLSRLLFLFFLILAFAQPSFKQNESNHKSLVGVYVDNSQSMLAPAKTGDVLAQAIEVVKSLSQNFPASTQYVFIDNDFKSTDVSLLNRDQLKDRLTEINVSGKTRNLEQVQNKIISNAERLGFKDNVQLYLLSDLQKSVNKNIKLQNHETSIIDCKSVSTYNVYVDSVYLDTPIINPDENSTVKVVLSCSGTEDAEDVQVKLNVNGVVVGSSRVNIVKGQQVTLDFNLKLNSQKSVQCQIQIEDNSIVFDNDYNFVLKAPEPVKITIISDNSENHFYSIFKNDPLFIVQNYTFNTINYGKLSNTQLLVIEGFENSNSVLLENVNKVISNNGTVVVLPSNNYKNGTFTENCKKISNATINLLTDTTNLGFEIIQMPDLKNPFFKNIYKSKNENVQLPKSKIVLNTSGLGIYTTNLGNNAISKLNTTHGNLYSINTVLKNEYSDLQTHPFLITFMLKLALSCNNSEAPLAYSVQTKFLKVSNQVSTSNKVYKLKSTQKEYMPNLVNQGVDKFLDLTSIDITADFYSLTLGDSLVQNLAFNAGKVESDIMPLETEELKRIIGKNNDIKTFGTGSVETTIKQLNDNRSNNYLWKYCLVIALVFLALEIVFIRVLK